MTDQTIPSNHVIAVINGDRAAQATASDLQQKGFGLSYLFRGEEAANTFDAKGEQAGPLGKVMKAVQDHLSEEPNYLAQYEEEARQGHGVIAVAIKDREQIDAVTEILERHGAVNVRFFGTLAVSDLTPDSNPSTRAEESPESKNWSHM